MSVSYVVDRSLIVLPWGRLRFGCWTCDRVLAHVHLGHVVVVLDNEDQIRIPYGAFPAVSAKMASYDSI